MSLKMLKVESVYVYTFQLKVVSNKWLHTINLTILKRMTKWRLNVEHAQYRSLISANGLPGTIDWSTVLVNSIDRPLLWWLSKVPKLIKRNNLLFARPMSVRCETSVRHRVRFLSVMWQITDSLTGSPWHIWTLLFSWYWWFAEKSLWNKYLLYCI